MGACAAFVATYNAQALAGERMRADGTIREGIAFRLASGVMEAAASVASIFGR